MDYLSDKLPADEKLKIEKLCEEPGLLNDAVQGLQQFENKKSLPAFVEQLNTELHKQLNKKKQPRHKRRFKSEQWIYVAIIIILTLAIIAFIIIRTALVR